MAPARDAARNPRWPPLFSERQWKRLVGRLRLTRRQSQVAECLCRDLKAGTIARELSLSLDSVRHHSKELFIKLSVNTRLGVVLCLLHDSRGRKQAT
ncbi:MAG TPA: LuxR C-terminal-related transcriptional regulator [Phycisphaerae bacterium]|nr:LuxR C-terminal-related transcriptional regulator [Phycisphaerae bacterium]